jgi:hypothetical protein
LRGNCGGFEIGGGKSNWMTIFSIDFPHSSTKISPPNSKNKKTKITFLLFPEISKSTKFRKMEKI